MNRRSHTAAPDILAAAAPGAPPRPKPPTLRAARARPPALGPDTAFTGGVLRQVREARGVTVEQLAEVTRIGRHHLENVEADRYERLPALAYLRGILTIVAKELRLDAAAVARTYLQALAASGARGK